MDFLSKKTATSIAITPIISDSFATWIEKQPPALKAQAKTAGYTGGVNSTLFVHNTKGQLVQVLYGISSTPSLYTYADLPAKLPQHAAGYYIDKKMPSNHATEAALAWALGSYQFNTYKSGKKKDFAALIWPDNADKKYVQYTAEAVFLVRDLINTPPNDLGPEELVNASTNLIKEIKKTSIKIITGDELLKKNYPMIHAVGKGSSRAPRLIDITWGNPKHPRVTLVGKGVVFDTGGLDIKPGSAMILMKKDMGGAAHALGLAHMIMSANLPIYLRVLIPAVENSVDGNGYRPSDIIKTRKGITVEIGDTDAEGRLVLADALTEACSTKPELVIDFATLTGAARVALGPDLPALFCNNEKTATDLLHCAEKTHDPMWRLPLWQPYVESFSSKVADTNNVGGQAGAIVAALFLQKFIEKDIPWVHIDTIAWNISNKPGRPEGGEALGMRACYELIQQRFAKK